MWPMLFEREPMVGLLEAKLTSLGIDGLLFDLDDTLLETSDYMDRYKLAFCVWAAEKLGISLEVVMPVFEKAAHDAFDILFVTLERWNLVVRMTAERLGEEPHCLDGGVEIMRELFLDSPRLIEGVRPVLAMLHQTGRKMGVVTHAPHNKWTEIKMVKTGIERYFDGVWIAGEDRLKGREDWEGGAAMIGVAHDRILGIGDSASADIWPMIGLKMRAIAIVPKWKRAKGELPEGVPLLQSLVGVPEAILAL